MTRKKSEENKIREHLYASRCKKVKPIDPTFSFHLSHELRDRMRAKIGIISWSSVCRKAIEDALEILEK